MNKTCKECHINKELSEFYNHPQGVMGTLPRCKECIKSGRRTERERIMARDNDLNRHNNPNRPLQVSNQRIKYRKKYPEKYKAHLLIKSIIRKHPELRQTVCMLCSISEGIIHNHHYDYNKPNEIIPCCPLCHKKFHKGEPIQDSYIIVLPLTN